MTTPENFESELRAFLASLIEERRELTALADAARDLRLSLPAPRRSCADVMRLPLLNCRGADVTPPRAFNVSARRVGGLRIIKIGRLCVSLSVSRPGRRFRSIKGARR